MRDSIFEHEPENEELEVDTTNDKRPTWLDYLLAYTIFGFAGVGVVLSMTIVVWLFLGNFDFDGIDPFEISKKDYGAVSCEVYEDKIEYGGEYRVVANTKCNPPPYLTSTSYTRAMTYLSDEDEDATPGEYLTCRWVEYWGIRFWPPHLEAYHQYEDCELVYYL